MPKPFRSFALLAFENEVANQPSVMFATLNTNAPLATRQRHTRRYGKAKADRQHQGPAQIEGEVEPRRLTHQAGTPIGKGNTNCEAPTHVSLGGGEADNIKLQRIQS